MTTRLTPAVVGRVLGSASLEWYLTDPLMFGLTTASPLQRAVARAADGVPLGELSDLKVCRDAFGNVDLLPAERPRELVLMSGIRTGKSLFAACAAVKMAMSCNIDRLRAGEVPRVSVVSLTKDLADVIFDHVVAGIDRSPMLRRRVISRDAETVTLVHPTGVPVEIKVVAGSRAGASLVARWSAGAIFDEFPRMVGSSDGVVNWDDMRNAVLLRVLDGCQLLHIGSPSAPFGPAFDLVMRYHGKPDANLVVVRAPAPAFNPVYWTEKRVADARAQDPDAAKTDVDAQFASPEEALFSSESVDKCLRNVDLEMDRVPGCTYFAAMDPATRGNGWTLAIATRINGKAVVVRADEWVGSRSDPLDPGEVLEQVARIVIPYGITTVHSDQVMGDALVKLARQHGISLAQWTYSSVERAKKYLAIRTNVDLGLVSLPNVPNMRSDLLHIRKKPTPAGMTIALPMTSDGRHCDWGPTLMLVLSRILPDQKLVDAPPERQVDAETLRLRQQMVDRFRRKDEW